LTPNLASLFYAERNDSGGEGSGFRKEAVAGA